MNWEPLLKTGITFAILKWFGTVPVVKEQLYRISRGLEIRHLRSLRTLIGILKGPAALPFLNSNNFFYFSSDCWK